MLVEDFKAGIYKQQYKYKSFSPSSINHVWAWQDPKINTLLEDAIKALSELNAFSSLIPNVELFIQMHITKEAQSSSRIEGTQTAIDEAILDKDQIAPEKRDDWQEVQNYIQTMNYAIRELEALPLSNRLLKQTHHILMQGVRGEHKAPGEFRHTQNWIGGSNLQDAAFIPPHQEEVPELMSDLEKFWYNEEIEVPHLVRIAISHYQFETIHPFCDGNGRIGRLLITLYLVSKGLLSKPSLYLSDYFEKNRGAYYDALTMVRTSNDLLHWLRFFLVAVIETAGKGRQTFQRILELKQVIDKQLITLGRKAENANRLVNHLYKKPSINVAEVGKLFDLTPTHATKLISDLERLDILKEVTGYKRNRIFMFHNYLKLFME